MPVAVQKLAPAPRERDVLDRLTGALGVANQVLGISAAFDAADQRKLMQQFAQNREEREGELFAQRQEEFGRKQAQLARESDTSSPLAKTVRAQAKTLGINLPKDVTAKEGQSIIANEIKLRGVTSDAELRDLQKMKLQQDLTRGPKLSQDQRKAATFAKRTMQAEDVFDKLEGQGFDATSLGTYAQKKLIPEVFKSSEMKQFEQAQRNFLNAVLRRESGAVISQEEFAEGAKQYFPQPGDTPEVLSQKRENRQLAIAALAGEAGDRALSDIEKRSPRSMVAEKPRERGGKDAVTAGKSLKSEGPHGARVMQNGVEYIWNPKTGQYE